MANKPKKKPARKKSPKHFGTSNGKIPVAKAKYDNQLVGASPNNMSMGC